MSEEVTDQTPGWWGWCTILFPPFLLLPLCRIPHDFGSTLLFFAGGIAAITSLLGLASFLTQYIASRVRKSTFKFQYKRIRSILTLLFFILVLTMQYWGRTYADQFALDVAGRMQVNCDRKQTCSLPESDFPEAEKHMEPERLIFIHEPLGKIAPMYRIFIYLEEENKKFSVHVRYDIDNGFSVSGGVGEKIETKLIFS